MTLAIDVHDLVKRYGPRTVVDRLSLSIEEGRICGFLGPNGSGKTTTLRMICGLLTPDAGGGTCLGHDLVREREAIKRQAGYMTQRFGLYEDLTIRENLEFVGRVYDLDRVKERVDASLERLGLATRQRQLAGALSGGWKQRLALAACVLHEPELLLLDEPLANLDPAAAAQVQPLIGRTSGRTRVVTSHDPAGGLEGADLALGLRGGRVALLAAASTVTAAQIAELYG
jgi:ABC-2 type transport system ATP-binding protein